MATIRSAWWGLRAGCMRAVHMLGTINAYILFGVLYIVGIGLYAIVWRVANLFRKPGSIGWTSALSVPPKIENLRRQF